LQAKLLEFLDTHEVRRLGDARPKTLDVRLIAATNSDLRSEVESGAFRRDLYYRLEEAPLHLLPLRYRREDIPLLMKYFLVQAEVSAPLLHSLPTQQWVTQALDVPWDGNVRELRHFIQQVTSLAGRQSAVRDFASWAERLIDFKQRNGGNGNGDREAAHERMKLLDALTRNGWNQRAAARELQMSEGGVRHMMRRYNVERPVEQGEQLSER
jgi:transcriptional regulator with GAF, ATPase, and Fis domain